MKSAASRTVRLEIASRIEMIEIVQTVLAHVSADLGFDEDAAHYMSVAVRESVVNAIKHGNVNDAERRVTVTFTLHVAALEVTVQDEGLGFDPAAVANPVAEENLLKPDGRGIFFMRSFMDDVRYTFPKKGGTVVTMLKKVAPKA
jgi:serine/threonine-protein kinase RsbW